MLAKLDEHVFLLTIAASVALALAGFMLAALRERLFPRTIAGRLRRFLGRGAAGKLEVHEKVFPGYDLASVNRALTSFFRDRGGDLETLGAFQASQFRLLLQVDDDPSNAYLRKLKPSAPAYQRLAVGVDEEESFVSNCLYLCELSPTQPPSAGPALDYRGGGADRGGGERLVVLLATQMVQADYDEDMDARSSPATAVNLSVACRSRQVADTFFAEIEARRKALSVFRGKVIDPVVAAGGIKSIGFRRIHPVAERDLVLPESVKSLVVGAVVNFYRSADTLRQLGVELKRGILFHSPPGTGKTSISLYLAGLLPNFTVCFVSGRRLLHPREVCAMARYLQPTMLVFEDIDLIAQERDHNGLATVLGELMNQIDGCEPNEQVLFIMNTNSMSRIEDAVRNRPGRVDQIIHIPLPDLPARRELIRHFGRTLGLSGAAVESAAAATDGATPALLKEVVKRAAVMAVTRAGGTGNGDGVAVTAEDLLLAVEQVQYQRERDVAIGSRLSQDVL